MQRWNPVDGFSDRLLPSDRWQWSDVTGLDHQPLESFQLPSESWEWEGDWYADENIGGEPTDKTVSSVQGRICLIIFFLPVCGVILKSLHIDVTHTEGFK